MQQLLYDQLQESGIVNELIKFNNTITDNISKTKKSILPMPPKPNQYYLSINVNLKLVDRLNREERLNLDYLGKYRVNR